MAFSTGVSIPVNQALFPTTQSGGSGSSFGSSFYQPSQSSTTQYPIDIAKLIESVGGMIGGLNTGQATQQNLNTFLNNPLSSELFSGTIGPLLEALGPSEEAARTALADQFRMAGGGQGGALQSGAFAKAAQLNERNILANRSNVVAQRASETFRNLLAGLGLGLQAEEAQTTPARLGVGLIGAIKPTGTTQTGGGGTTGWENIPPSQGLNTPMASDRSSGAFGGIGSDLYRPPSIYEERPPPPPPPPPPPSTPGVNFTGLGGGGYDVQYDPYTGRYVSDPGNISNLDYFNANNYLTPEQMANDSAYNQAYPFEDPGSFSGWY